MGRKCGVHTRVVRVGVFAFYVVACCWGAGGEGVACGLARV